MGQGRVSQSGAYTVMFPVDGFVHDTKTHQREDLHKEGRTAGCRVRSTVVQAKQKVMVLKYIEMTKMKVYNMYKVYQREEFILCVSAVHYECLKHRS